MNDTELLKHLAKYGNCAGMDTEIFFEPDNSRGAIVQNLPTIKKVCGNCVVKNKCLDYAMRHDVAGVWAGTSHGERKIMRKKLGLKAEPVAFDIYVPRLKGTGHHDMLLTYIEKHNTCRNGHRLRSAKDVLVTYYGGSQTPSFKCKPCAVESGKRYRKKVSALRTEPSRG